MSNTKKLTAKLKDETPPPPLEPQQAKDRAVFIRDNVKLVLRLREEGKTFDEMNTSFFLSRDTVVPTDIPGMALWREILFAWMYQNAGRQSDFFKIPANRLVELGAKVEI